METTVRAPRPIQDIVESVFDKVTGLVERLAQQCGVGATGLLQQAYELHWQNAIGAAQFEDLNDLWRLRHLLLGMSRAPKASVMSGYVDLGKRLAQDLERALQALESTGRTES